MGGTGSGGTLPNAGGGGHDSGGAASGSAGTASGGMAGSAGGPVAPVGPEGILQNAPTAAAEFATYNPFIFFKIVSKPSGQVLSVAGEATDNGENGVVRADTGADNQLWSIQDSVQGFKRFINKRSGRALSTDHQGGAVNGAGVHIWQYLGNSADQDWSVAPHTTDTVKIVSSARVSAVFVPVSDRHWR